MPKLLNNEQLKKILRIKREKECFSVINRGKLWYDCLTNEQVAELKTWYWDWLNCTESLIIPVKPSWLDNKLEEEEIVI